MNAFVIDQNDTVGEWRNGEMLFHEASCGAGLKRGKPESWLLFVFEDKLDRCVAEIAHAVEEDDRVHSVAYRIRKACARRNQGDLNGLGPLLSARCA